MQILSFTWYWKLIIRTINSKNKNLLKYGQQSDFLNGLKSLKTVEGPFFFFLNDYAEHKMISTSINWYAGGFCEACRKKKSNCYRKFTNPENNIILSSLPQRENGLSPPGGDFKKPRMPQGEI